MTMTRFAPTYFAVAALMILAVGPLRADDAGSQPAPPAVSSQEAAGDAQAQENPAGCPADGKCCGSAACGEAKKRSMTEGKAAMADCPCKRNRVKPEHAP